VMLLLLCEGCVVMLLLLCEGCVVMLLLLCEGRVVMLLNSLLVGGTWLLKIPTSQWLVL
jgi:hypothetical protein